MENEPKKENAFETSLRKYRQSTEAEKAAIAAEPKKWRRFWKRLLYWLFKPFRYLWAELHDWRFLVVFAVVIVAVGSEVWVPLVLAGLFWGDEAFRISMLATAGTFEAFWLAPFTPFLGICIALTIAIKAGIDKIAEKRKGK